MRWRLVAVFLIGCVLGYAASLVRLPSLAEHGIITPLGTITKDGKITNNRPLDAYTIENLGKRTYTPGSIIFDTAVATTSAYTQYLFHYDSDGKKVTGLANVPNNGQAKHPVIVQYRGYIPRDSYTPGAGTRHSGEVYAAAGFLTLAPDFLGFAGSDMPSKDVFEERFQTYTAALNLLAAVPSLPDADTAHIGIWGHSNGGHIALTVLEILPEITSGFLAGMHPPATLWAPVSKPFPYSILYYTDEADDHGKALRKELATFEKTYDTELYSLTNYLDNIDSDLIIHQGSADDAVPQVWTDTLVQELRDRQKQVTYYVYPGADHDMNGGWDTVVTRDIDFFNTEFSK